MLARKSLARVGPRVGSRLLAAVFCGFVLLLSVFAQAQEPAAEGGPADASVDQLRALAATLEDDTERRKLAGQLRALIEARTAIDEAAQGPESDSLGARLLATLSDRVQVVGSELSEAVNVVLDLPRAARFVADQAGEPATRQRWLEIAAKLALILAAGLIAEWLSRRLLARSRDAVRAREGDSALARAVLFLTLGFLELVPIAAFAAAAYGVLPLTEPRPVTRLVALAIVNANVLVRAVTAVATLSLLPNAGSLRPLPVSDETAQYAFIWIRRLAVVAVYGYFVAEAALLLGLPSGAHAFLVKAIGLLVASMVVVLILQNRSAVANRLRGGAATEGGAGALGGLRNRLGDVWHVLAILYVIATFGVWALDVAGGFQFLVRATALTVAVLVAARLLTGGLGRAFERGFRLKEDTRVRFPGIEARANRYLIGLRRGFQLLVHALAALAVLQVWGLDALAWLASESGRLVVSRLVTIAFIVAGALVLWEVVAVLIERYLEERDGAGGKVERSARARTLLPLLRNAIRIALAVLVSLTVLSELGINIGPLLAGAGVLGLAIGFGAQTLVRDVITGVFILLEDGIAVGDVVDLGGHAGVVEGMTIRTVRLRDVSGTVHMVPFGEVSAVLNMTRDFSFAVIDAGIAYREDVDEVIEVLKEIGAGLQADETYGPLILEPLEVLGLDSFGESSVNIRVRLKTRPIKQWMVRREFHRRMKKVFDERGIEIPFPHQTLYFGVDKEGKAPAAHIALEPTAAPTGLGQPSEGKDAGAAGAEAPEPRRA